MLGGDPRIIKYREATQQRFPRPFKVSDVENSKAIGSGVKQQHLQPPDARGRGALGDLYPTTGGSGHSSIVGDLAWELPSIAPAPSADTSTWSSGGGAAPPSFPHATSSTIISSPYGPGMIAGEGVSLATTPGALASSFIPSYAPGTPDIYSSPAAMWRETSSPPRCAANPPSLPVGLLLSDLPGRSSGSSDGSRELLPDITDTDVSDAGPSSPHTHRQQQPATSGDGWGTVMDHDPRDRSASSSPKLDDDEGLLRLAIGHAAAHGRCHPPTLNAHAGSTRAGTTYSAGGGGASSRGAWSGANTVEEAWGIVDVLQGQVLDLQRQLHTARVLIREAGEHHARTIDSPRTQPVPSPAAMHLPAAGEGGRDGEEGEGARNRADAERTKGLERDVDMLMMERDRLMREKVAWLIERAQLNEETSRMRRAMEMSERIRQQREGGSEAGRANEALLLLRMKSELQGLQEECAKAARAEAQWAHCRDARSGQVYWTNSSSSQSVTWCLWPLAKTVFYVPQVPLLPSSHLQPAQGPPPTYVGHASLQHPPPNIVPVSPGVSFQAVDATTARGPVTPTRRQGIISSIFGSKKR